jgi:aryl-alcohol dehydrogenase-like predicted oxidoreductase
MRYRFIGTTGVLASELSLGSLTFSTNKVWNLTYNLSQHEVDNLVGFSIDMGINFFDTADVYGFGEAEKKLGSALGVQRKNILLASKVKFRVDNHVNGAGLSRVHIINQIEKSLQNLRSDYLDFYFIHGFDKHTHIDETITTMDNLVKSGKVRYIGISNLYAWQTIMFLEHAKNINCQQIKCLQMYYSLIDRGIEREYWSLLEQYNLGLFIWSPLAGGFLSEKYLQPTSSSFDSRLHKSDFPPFDKINALRINQLLKQIAKNKNATISQVALAFVLKNKCVTSILLGCRNMSQLKENLKSTEIQLDNEEYQLINEITKLPLEYPGWYMNMPSDRFIS